MSDDLQFYLLIRDEMLKKTPKELEGYINSSFFNDFIKGYCVLLLEAIDCDNNSIEKVLNVCNSIFDMNSAHDALIALKRYH